MLPVIPGAARYLLFAAANRSLAALGMTRICSCESRIPNPESRIPNPESRIPNSPMPSILLVEDETAIADTVLYALRTEGSEAQHCLTGQDALRAGREGRHDLAILDVGLPDIGGFALCRELRRGRDLPVIFLTARDAEADRVLGLELGADDYVVKPF